MPRLCFSVCLTEEIELLSVSSVKGQVHVGPTRWLISKAMLRTSGILSFRSLQKETGGGSVGELSPSFFKGLRPLSAAGCRWSPWRPHGNLDGHSYQMKQTCDHLTPEPYREPHSLHLAGSRPVCFSLSGSRPRHSHVLNAHASQKPGKPWHAKTQSLRKSHHP